MSKSNTSKESASTAGGSGSVTESPQKKVKRGRGDLPPGFETVLKGKKKHYFLTEQPEKRFSSVNACWEYHEKVASEHTETAKPATDLEMNKKKKKEKEDANDSDSGNEENVDEGEEDDISDSVEDEEPAQKLVIPPVKDTSPSSSESSSEEDAEPVQKPVIPPVRDASPSSSEDEDDAQPAAPPSLVAKPAPASPVRKPAPASPVRKPAPSTVSTPGDLKLKPAPVETKRPEPKTVERKSASSSDSDNSSDSDSSSDESVSSSKNKTTPEAIVKSPMKEQQHSKPSKVKPQPSGVKNAWAQLKDDNSLNGSPKVSVSSHNGTSADHRTPKPSKELKRKVESSSESDDELRNANH